jgi:hypothetical protein
MGSGPKIFTDGRPLFIVLFSNSLFRQEKDLFVYYNQ